MSALSMGSRAGLAIAFALVAVLLGILGGLVGWEGQLVLFLTLVPAVVLAVDYRVGLVIALLVLPYANARILPSFGPLKMENILLAGIALIFLVRWSVGQARGRPIAIPWERHLGLYLVTLIVAMCIGTLHLDEVSPHYLFIMDRLSFDAKDYWISFHLKHHLLMLALAMVLGAAVIERGGEKIYAILVVVSGFFFAAAIAAVFIAAGASLQQLQNERSLLIEIGRHNNEAGSLLLGAIGPALFMREFVRSRLTRTGLLVALISMICALFLTMSRGALLGFLLMVAFYIWRFRKPSVIVATVVLSLAGFAILPDAIQDRLLQGVSTRASISERIADPGESDLLTSGRFAVWSMLAPEILNSPLVGRGVASTQWSTAVRTGVLNSGHPHSFFLEILMDVGFLGAVLIALFYRFLWQLFNRLARNAQVADTARGYFLGSAAAMLGMFGQGLGDGHWYPAPEQLFLWASIGLALGCHRRLSARESGLGLERAHGWQASLSSGTVSYQR